MQRRPRRPNEPLFGRQTWSVSLLQGLGVLVILAVLYGVALHRGQAEPEARALAFTTLIIANIGLILINRSWKHSILETVRSPNPALWWVTGGALSFLGLVLFVPVLRGVFRFGELDIRGVSVSLLAGAASILWFELFKFVSRRRAQAE